MKKIIISLIVLLAVCLTGCQKEEFPGMSNEEIKEGSIFLCDDKYCLVGSYFDTVGQRANMEISVNADDTYNIKVNWSNDANSLNVWTISSAKFDLESKKINYLGEYIDIITYDSEGKEISKETSAINNVGYFSLENENLLWLGAGQEECRSCIFAKVVQL